MGAVTRLGACPLAPPPMSARSRTHGRRRTAALVSGANVVAFSVLVAEQATEWSTTWHPVALVWWVGGVTLVIGAVLVAAFALATAFVRPWWARAAVAAALAAVQSLVRTFVLLPAMVADHGSLGAFAAWATGLIGYAVALGTGMLVAALLEREDRERERRRAEEAKARAAIDDLENEELRVRRLVADRLHGAVQHRLVAVAAGLDQVADRLTAGDPDPAQWAPQLRDWALDLDELREEHVRSLSHTLFPSGADLGTYEAIRALLDRLPTTVATSVELGPAMRDLVHERRAPLPLLDRLVVVYTVEEAVTNALKHGGADRVTVRVEAERAPGPDRWVLDVIVDDNGTGPSADDPPLSGLVRHRARAESRGGSLALGGGPDGGRLHLVLPFTATPAT